MADQQQASQEVFREKDRVEAVDDELPGVPAGTRGRITEVTGLSWIRYRVQFDNGREVNLVDGRHLRRAGGDRR